MENTGVKDAHFAEEDLRVLFGLFLPAYISRCDSPYIVKSDAQRNRFIIADRSRGYGTLV